MSGANDLCTAKSQYCRKVCFANRSIAIATDQVDAERLIEHIFSDIDSQSSVAAHCQFSISKTDDLWLLQQCSLGPGQQQLLQDNVTLYRGESAGDLSSVLVGEVIYHLTDRCDSGLVLHAAAVRRDDICVALPAASGSGKTTLCAWLVDQGWHYLTDELIHIPLNTLQIDSFTRPFNFKQPGYPLIAREFGLDTDADYSLTGSFASLIAHRQLADWSPSRPELTLTHLVFPRYGDNHAGALTQLSPARAGLSLMECLVNARNLPQHGFEEVSRVVRHLRAFSFEYSSFDTARSQLLPALSAS